MVDQQGGEVKFMHIGFLFIISVLIQTRHSFIAGKTSDSSTKNS